MTYTNPGSVDLTSSNGLVNFWNWLNTVTFGWFSNMFLLSIYCIILFGFYKASDDFPGAMAVSGFVTFILSLLLWLKDLVNGFTFSICIAMAILGVVVLLSSSNQ